MARITVEDCIDKFPSRFELVLVAANRSRKLHSGENPTLEIDNDKNTVIALREIAEETLTKEQLQNDLIEQYQTVTFNEDDDLEELEDNSDENQSDENKEKNNQFNEEIEQENQETEVKSNDENTLAQQNSLDDNIDVKDNSEIQDKAEDL
tara:strand:- start:374 stop:826 length:453 start_codon:yes stop_codon:yes gene_type:complete